MPEKEKPFEQFLDCSVLLTGYGRLDLLGTGMCETYHQTLLTTIGEKICGELWDKIGALKRAHSHDPDALEEAITQKIVVADQKLGPVVKAIIQMWYLGQWAQTPPAWREKYGTNPNDFTRVISAEAYTEGLVWRAAGTHPQAAKQPGYGSWSDPPVQITLPDEKAPKKAAAGGQK